MKLLIIAVAVVVLFLGAMLWPQSHHCEATIVVMGQVITLEADEKCPELKGEK